MHNFSLSRSIQGVFPESISVSGNTFPIRADFRNILKIFRMLEDEDVLEWQKPGLVVKWFYAEEGCVPKEGALTHFMAFVNPEAKGAAAGGEDRKPKQFDFEADAAEIYTSFLKEYGIDLMDISFLHWYRFRLLLRDLSADSPFKRKLKLRHMDMTGLKGKALAEASRAKEAVKLPEKLSLAEKAERAAFEAEWGGL